MGARTIAIYPPSAAGETNNFGLLIWKPEDLQKAHRILAAAGWQLVTHAIGDRAMDEVLDSYAATVKSLNLSDPRFRIVHGGISTPAIQKRLKEQRVIVDGNPAFVLDWKLVQEVRTGARAMVVSGQVMWRTASLRARDRMCLLPDDAWWGFGLRWCGANRRPAKSCPRKSG
jgi:predicted amidohydrolase YtcJ